MFEQKVRHNNPFQRYHMFTTAVKYERDADGRRLAGLAANRNSLKFLRFRSHYFFSNSILYQIWMEVDVMCDVLVRDV